MAEHILRLDRNPLELVQDAYNLSRSYQQVRLNQYSRDYKLYSGFIDIADRDPDRANIFVPKIFSIVETKVPRDVKALIGARPYIPFEAKRPEFRFASQRQTQILDEYLDRGGFYTEFTSASKIKTLYGTSFIEALPYYEMVKEKQIVPEIVMGVPVGQRIVEKKVPRLRFRIKAYAPWEVYIDPFATNLEQKGGCHYIIKAMLVRKEQIWEMYQNGAYPGMDEEAFMKEDDQSAEKGDHWGLQMLNDLGLSQTTQDEGVGILLRFESEKRYIDLWNGRVVLRDIPNTFNHGMVNLSRYIHIMDAHTQNQFWGIGEGKPGEILQQMLNDTWNMTFNNHNMMNQGMTYYRADAVDANALVRTVGNKIPIDASNDRPISDSIHESFGQPLPADHYNIPASIERMLDLESGIWEMQRGEQSQSGRTATEQAMRKEYGDSRQELNVRLGEMIFLKSFGEKMLSMIDQFATVGDIVEIVGEQGAQEIMGLNPADLPGGYNFTFKGSNRVANVLMKQRNWKELYPLLLQSPNVLQGKLNLKMLEVYEENEKTSEEMIIPDEVMAQMQQQAQQQEMIDIEQEAQRNHQRDLELARAKAAAKERGSKLKDNKRKSKGKGATHSKNQPSHSTESEAQHQAKTAR